MKTFVLAAVTAAFLVACRQPAEDARLAGAICTAIPVFEPSRVVGVEDYTFSAGDDFVSMRDYRGRRWELATDAPYADVVAFYARVMPPTEPEEAMDEDAGEDTEGLTDEPADEPAEDPAEETTDGPADEGEGEGEPAAPSETWSMSPEGFGPDLHVEVTVERAPAGNALIVITESTPADRQ